MTDVLFASEGGGAAVVTQRKCAENAFVRKDGVIIEYRLEGADPKSAPLKMRSPAEGVVQYKPGTKRGDRLADGAPLCTLADCKHQVVMKDMCATCGENLREKDGRPGERKTTTTASVPMKHSLPELLVSDEREEEAMEEREEEEENEGKEEKENEEDSADGSPFCLQHRVPTSQISAHERRMRFARSTSAYLNKIARADGLKHKEACLAARKLVLLVDLDQTVIHTTNRPPSFDPSQHPDITQFQLYGGHHWTKLRPHTRQFFENLSSLYEMHIITFGQRQYAHKIAEIIDPTRHIFLDRILSRDESLSLEHKTANLAALFPAGEEMVAIIDDRADVWQYIDALVQLRPYKYFREVDDINAPPGAAERRPEQQAESGESSEEREAAASALPVETDETLVHVEKVLKKVHEAFYKHYDETGKVRDVKLIIRSLRAQTLKDYILVLSGLVPVDSDPRKVDAYRIATAFGAKVEDRVGEHTTHVVAARWGTTKVYEARRLNVPIVKPRWLYACMELWEKAPEEPYLLTEESVRPQLETSGADMAMMGADMLSDMNKELDSLSDEDESDEEDEDEDDGEAWKNPADRVRAPEVARPKIDESRVKRKLPVEALDRGYTGESAGEDDEDDDPFGGTSSKRAKRRGASRGGGAEMEDEAAREDRLDRDDEDDEEAAERDYGDDADEEALEDEDDDGDMDDMAAELEHQLEH